MSTSSLRASAGPVRLPDLSERRILITGATSGIGLHAAGALVEAGAHVLAVGRDPARLEAALGQLRARRPDARVDGLRCDLSSLPAVRELAQQVLDRYDRLHVLVNNAGTVMDEHRLSPEGFELTLLTNHLAPFLLTHLLLPRLRESGRARVVNVSSKSHYDGRIDLDDWHYKDGGYQILRAYARSKLCNVLHAQGLARRHDPAVLTANSLHPGVVATNIWSGAPWYARPFLALGKLFMISPEQGGRTITFLAGSEAVEGVTGKYFDDNEERRPSRLARDEALEEEVWKASAAMVGV